MAENLGYDFFNNLPQNIIIDILSRLSADLILQVRCVCKAWLQLISDPEFVSLHLSRSPCRLIVNKLCWNVDQSRFPDPADFRVLGVEDEPDHHGVRHIARLNFETPKSDHPVVLGMIGSIDGLVCIARRSCCYPSIHVWNPTLREFVTLPRPPGDMSDIRGGFPCRPIYGFGTSSGKYHVVRIFPDFEPDYRSQNLGPENQYMCHIYTIGAGSWKSIGHEPYRLSNRGLFLNGKLHWIIQNLDSPDLILCLDLEKGLFQPVPSPRELLKINTLPTLNLYNGCLSMCQEFGYYEMEIWVMKEYWILNSWSKELVIEKYSLPTSYHFREHSIIKLFKDGEMLLFCGGEDLCTYNPRRKTNAILSDVITAIREGSKFDPILEICEYIPSFISLKDLGENVIVKSLTLHQEGDISASNLHEETIYYKILF